ncbi:DNA alkylation repair protein [Salinibacillus xinjiangensis]|uniref:DNA alkylation repair protein n=1 Tax=Salinibacillus xinjiangensis TaxID=1229268 RepID=A0A6G1X584_9BACI|nr:DNA alkylation repair protein [Salinibacillus xinjiangensis]MRG86161.1 DNA alkylation repair protein [Salinibacillus xinjiangensis]
MASPYLCPNCRTNRSRFNIIEQKATPVKLDPQSGDVLTEFAEDNVDIMHVTYKGPEYKVQCGVCGLIEDERSFIKHAEFNQKNHN